jgi:hypothetical protein
VALAEPPLSLGLYLFLVRSVPGSGGWVMTGREHPSFHRLLTLLFFYRKVDTFRKKKHVTIVIVRGEEPTFGRVTVYQSVSSSVVHFKWVFFLLLLSLNLFICFFFSFPELYKREKNTGEKEKIRCWSVRDDGSSGRTKENERGETKK